MSDDLKLTREECLELELINTKKQMLQQQAQAQAGQLDSELEKLSGKINERLSINIREYQIELSTGNLKKLPLPGLPQGQDAGQQQPAVDQQAAQPTAPAPQASQQPN